MRISSDDIDTASVDAALSTTRAVRIRLDLERDVDQQTILDCIDIAEQAPTGGNQGSRRWVVVRDSALKDRLAELYLDSAGRWMIDARDTLAGSGHRNESVMTSAAHLAEHLADVPAIVIPTIIGRHDGSGRPGLFDSVIQAAWSFAVALRARGLGTTWTTAALNKETEIAELLNIPADMTQIAMLPVAWTIGTDFSPATRYPARDITYFDEFARTYESGPSNPISMADGPGTLVEQDIDAPIERLWELISDIDMPAQFSTEFLGATWSDDVGERPEIGDRFTGRNVHESRGEWEVECFIDRYDAPYQFGWATSDVDSPGARWRFELEPIAGSTRVRFRLILGPGPSGITRIIEKRPDLTTRVIDARLTDLRANMQRVVDGLATLV